MAGTFTLGGLSASEPTGERVFGPVTIQGSQVVGETLAVPLAQGDNTYAVPAGAVAVWIQGPVNGGATLTLRTVPADVGLPIDGQGHPMVWSFPAIGAPASIIINASVAQATPLFLAFI